MIRDTRLDDDQLGLLVYGLYQTKHLLKASDDAFYTELFHISANYMRKKLGDINDELSPYMVKRRIELNVGAKTPPRFRKVVATPK